jgi:hypothetical protein
MKKILDENQRQALLQLAERKRKIARCMDDLAKVEENCQYEIELRINGVLQLHLHARGVFLDIDVDNMTAEFRPLGEDVMSLTLDNIWNVRKSDGR